jgi:hypothetical protein
MNTKSKQVEMRTSKFTSEEGSALQKGADFLRAFTLGFDVDVPNFPFPSCVDKLGRYFIITIG